MYPVRSISKFIGASTATKPTASVQPGSTFYEHDTGRLFTCPDGDHWFLKSDSAGFLTASTTIDLKQAAAAYDLFEAESSAVQVLQLCIIIPADLTGDAAAGSLTSIKIESTDDTPVAFITAAQGAKANLTKSKHLIYTGSDVVAVSKKVQLTIAGGATTDNQVCSVWMAYREVA